MIKNKKLKIGMITLVIAGLLLASIPVYATNQAISPIVTNKTTKEVRDLGWTTFAASERNLTISKSMNYTNTSGLTTLTHEFNLYHFGT